MKAALSTLLLTAAVISSQAQTLSYGKRPDHNRSNHIKTTYLTPFMKNDRDENGKRIYIYLNPQFSRSSLSVSYGFMPINSFGWWTKPIFNSKYSTADYSNTGAISLSYNWFITPWLEMQIPITFSNTTGKLANIPHGQPTQFSESWSSFTPNIKLSWFTSKYVTIYSRLGIGMTAAVRHQEYQNTLTRRINVTWQFSPAGIEVGRRVNFFVEAGMGELGTVRGGLKLYFNKAKKPDYLKEYR